MPYEPKISEDDLCQKIIEIQTKDPMITEAGICRELKVNLEYIADRSKTSTNVLRARKVAAAIRHDEWAKFGVRGITLGKEFNATTYIWMTRNILKWSDRIPESEGVTVKDGKLIIDLSTNKPGDSRNKK